MKRAAIQRRHSQTGMQMAHSNLLAFQFQSLPL
jgi:hypothetical protein